MGQTTYPPAPVVLQTGSVTPGHVTTWNTNGVVQDGGTANNGNITSLGIQNSGNPAMGISNAPATSPFTAYTEGFLPGTSTFQIGLNSFGGASVANLQYNINGTVYAFPFGGGAGTGNVTGPNSAVSGDLVSFNGTSGTLIEDSGIAAGSVATGPSSATAGDLVAFNSSTGKVLGDSGIPSISVPRSIETISALELSTSITLPQNICIVLGFSSTGDGGGGIFSVGASVPANGGTIINDESGRSWYRETQGQPFSVKWFGAKGDGTTNDQAAIQSTLNVCIASNNGVYFPSGTYVIGSNLSCTFVANLASLEIFGEGADSSILDFGSGFGLTVNYISQTNSISVRNISFTTGGAGTGTAISLVQSATSIPNPSRGPLTVIDNVGFRGNDGYNVTNFWEVSVAVNGVSQISFVNVQINGPTGVGFVFVGSGVTLSGTSSVIPAIYNFVNCGFWYIANGIVYGDNVQGVAVSQCNFVGGSTGVLVPSGTTGILSQLAVSNSQFNVGNDAILTDASIGNVLLSNNLFFPSQANTAGVNLAASEGFNITGNFFQGPGGSNTSTGIDIGSNAANLGGIITGNNFADINIGITLGVASTKVNVQSNSYAGIGTTDVSNAGTDNTVGGGSV